MPLHHCPSVLAKELPVDAKRFDAIAKALIFETSRRRTLGGFLFGALGLLGLADRDDAAAKSGKCKPTCTACQTCKKGKCTKTKHGKRCKKGKCQPNANANGTDCGGACLECQSGTCAAKADTTACGAGGTSRCCSGQCRECCAADPTFTSCGSLAGCFCILTTEGTKHCHLGGQACDAIGACTTSANCPAGAACSAESFCTNKCLRGCAV